MRCRVSAVLCISAAQRSEFVNTRVQAHMHEHTPLPLYLQPAACMVQAQGCTSCEFVKTPNPTPNPTLEYHEYMYEDLNSNVMMG